ncbi:hypothetical protein B4073_2371 [Bacillus subtilis]|uniref:Uncharacterized protein n=1 Tax=Bacillus subtilis subsp. subtilis TaxID=135461 RepID=A0ABD3ZYP1_BACIU|nr:hypothetical protein B4067_2552 [Bacillus subtilis subsp. subtilis]KIN30670.1 hypothetical protein B4069_2359 [Bacillus subtilis]KIN31940.1 hypothetical protein B4068_2357 [Bacillus subtilis]KIN37205.1 hypothetical protein B4071_2213 [Bacillus subtilis]KIN40583.1 hypothetical protein B4070_2233 [Bacillus subtilis]
MAFDKTIHVMKVTGMFAATYFTGVTASRFCFHYMFKIIQARKHGSASKK